MRLTYFESNADYEYPYQVLLWAPVDVNIVKEMKDWAYSNNVRASYVPNRWYFRDKKDATMFLLKWS